MDDFDDIVSGTKKSDTGFFGVHREPVRGRKWDHARDKEPVILQAGASQADSPWRIYIKSSMYGPGLTEDPKKVDPEFLQQQTPGYLRPWRGDLENDGDPEKGLNVFRSKKKQRTLFMRVQVCSFRGEEILALIHNSTTF